CSLIGAPIAGATCGIGLCIDDDGNAFGIDLVGNNIRQVSLATGAPIGPALPLGFDINFGQDYAFDHPSLDGLIYGYMFDNLAFSQYYVSINPNTGAVTIITNFGLTQSGSFSFCSESGGGGGGICNPIDCLPVTCPDDVTVACFEDYVLDANNALAEFNCMGVGGGGGGVETFEFTGSVQTWTVPAGVTSITVDAYGASGGQGTTG